MTNFVLNIITLFFAFNCFAINFPPVTVFDNQKIVYFADEDQAYFKEFPRDNYKEYPINGLGAFLLDDIDDYIKNRLRKGIWWEKNIAEILATYAKPGSVALDLGSHIGVHTLTLSKAVGPKGKVFAFEPQKKIFFELVQNMVRNNCSNVRAYRSALGDTIGVIEMNNPSDNNEGGTCVGSGGDTAPLYTVDSFNFKNVSVIKMDCENFEEFVLNGAIETIKRSKPVIVIEIIGNKRNLPVNPELKKNQIIDQIRKMNYTVNNIQGADYICLPK